MKIHDTIENRIRDLPDLQLYALTATLSCLPRIQIFKYFTDEHSHLAGVKADFRRVRNAIKQCAEDKVNESPTQIVLHAVSQVSGEEVIMMLPDENTLKRQDSGGYNTVLERKKKVITFNKKRKNLRVCSEVILMLRLISTGTKNNTDIIMQGYSPTDTREEMDNESVSQFSENEILSVLCSASKTGETSVNINKGVLPDNSNAKENRPSQNGLLQIRDYPSSVTDVDDPEEFVSATYSTSLHSSEQGLQRALQLQELKALHERSNTEESRRIQSLCLGASYVVRWELAKALKPFTDVNLVQSMRVQFQDELIDLQSNVEFITKCREYDLTSAEVLKNEQDEISQDELIRCHYVSLDICVRTILFSRLKIAKFKHRSRLTDEHILSQMRIAVNSLEIDFRVLGDKNTHVK
ncbi:hypothetical protein ANN_24836 [Periplaneta americana]|uniref:Uncharacterized protein n=1 Tax=Periplaneta americana TaxID=6978 RepID=A0ABQ8S005_PERAM|nr:hypothetical protein ANN_24836 [Periplaneta americana]